PSASSEPTPLPSALARSSSGTSPKHVRFALEEGEGFIVPERDGPHGPKPLGFMDNSASGALLTTPHTSGKGHRKKHVPGTEGPETWTGIGKEPSKQIRDAFPPEKEP